MWEEEALVTQRGGCGLPGITFFFFFFSFFGLFLVLKAVLLPEMLTSSGWERPGKPTMATPVCAQYTGDVTGHRRNSPAWEGQSSWGVF